MFKLIFEIICQFLSKKHEIDDCFGYPRTDEFYELLIKKDWVTFEKEYLSLRIDERHVLSSSLTEKINEISLFDEWNSNDSSALPLIFKSKFLIGLAFEARGERVASTVSEDNIKTFFKYLEEAYDVMSEARTKGPLFSEGYDSLFSIMTGLSFEVKDFHELFNEFLELNVIDLDVALNVVDSLAEKWIGSHEEMFEFARSLSKNNPYYNSLIAIAHIEKWLDFSAFDEDENGEEMADVYFKQPEVVNELISAVEGDQCLVSENKYFSFMAHNLYAFVEVKMGRFDKAKQHFLIIGNNITTTPWCYEGFNELWIINRARKKCGLKKLKF
ncbi:MAG: hypothetical protein COA79_04495 [Planctomycetota bacterium]|nr:MAG: hypothetical protein COA79_04495 [Planctomycetota bacterium]